MTNDEAIQQAVNLARSGERAAARQLLENTVRQEPQNARAWYLLSQLVDTSKQTIYCLEKVLEVDPTNEQAITRLEKLKQSAHISSSSTSSPASPSKVESTKKGSDLRRKIVGGFVFLGLPAFCLLTLAILFLSSDSNSGPRPTKTPYQPTPLDVHFACQTFVKDQLKAPSTAVFPAMPERGIRDTTNQNIFQVNSYVDSQNSFGAMIRTDYVCIVEFVTKGQWILIDLKFSE